MRRVSILIFIVLTLLGVYFLALSGRMGKVQSEIDSNVPFKYIHNKTILPVNIGNSRTLNIILDSGMGYDGLLIMNPNLKDSIQLRNPVFAKIGGGGGGSSQNAIFSDSMHFSVGNNVFINQRIIVLQGDSFKDFSFDGVTGYTLFGHYMVEINNDYNTISLHSFGSFTVDKSWFDIPIYFNENNIPWIDVMVSVNKEQPIQLSCYIDYASSEAIELLQKENQKFTLPDRTEEYYLGRGLSGDIYGRKGKIAKVIIGPYELTNINAAFTPFKSRSKQLGADGIVANSLLRRFNLIFDYQNKKLYIKPNSNCSE